MGADFDLLDVAAPPSLRAGSSVTVSPEDGTVSCADGARIGRLPNPIGRAATGRVRTLRRDGETVVGVTVRLDERKESVAAAAAPAVPPPRGERQLGANTFFFFPRHRAALLFFQKSTH